ncbi:hypothetical protein O181_060566 [Austropuccinia psidii MF-1]|uniref:Uncharacterized protein n=1 Tax=Austropuccinia psidii MF-1 TaxID=1389203 RepID=A0A9Q3EL53_9BASI|nr:hypothetical protein [Austropuccinia psidii MF-1]
MGLESSWQHPLNERMTIIFDHTFCLALVGTEYHHFCWDKDQHTHGVVSSLMEQYPSYLKKEWKAIQQNPECVTTKREKQRILAPDDDMAIKGQDR